MPEANFKKLHGEWKDAKKDAKTWYDHWARAFGDIFQLFDTGQDNLARFPAFSLGLGPSLDNLQTALDNIKKAKEKKKDPDKKDAEAVVKHKKKAHDATSRYLDDIKNLSTAVGNKPVPEIKDPNEKQKENLKRAGLIKVEFLKKLAAFEEVRKNIVKALINIK